MNDLDLPRVQPTAIAGLLIVRLPVHGDARGWFKEQWQREKLSAAGLPGFQPVQQSVSFNASRGTTRGIHAEPWDKYVGVASGRVFGAWVDLREGDGFGTLVTAEIGPDTAVYVPRGVGNSFQTLEDDTTYTYLVNDHWSPSASYTFLNLADGQVRVPWPIPLEESERSAKDLVHPALSDVVPVRSRSTLVIGAGGQLGRAFARAEWDRPLEVLSREDYDLADPGAPARIAWRDYDTVINCGAFTAVDAAETGDGRVESWRVNAQGVARLAERCTSEGVRLVHFSSDYVFDGSIPEHDEDEPFSPLSVYGQSKAAADVVVATVPRHLIVRTSWVIGEGRNFVETMRDLAVRGVDPTVVADQTGRLTFTSDLVDAVRHLLTREAPSGTYNISCSGEPASWADIARWVFEATGHDPGRVRETSTVEYSRGKTLAPRPEHSALRLDRIRSLGYAPRDQREALRGYLLG